MGDFDWGGFAKGFARGLTRSMWLNEYRRRGQERRQERRYKEQVNPKTLQGIVAGILDPERYYTKEQLAVGETPIVTYDESTGEYKPIDIISNAAFRTILADALGMQGPEAKRKYLGLDKPKEKKISATQRKMRGILRGMMQDDRPVEEINKYILLKGYELSDFDDLIKEYAPENKVTFRERLVNKLTGGRFGQKYPKKEYKGHTYERREDGLWHRVD